ncbi:hypothetical protein VYI41_01370 [Streptococcus anginosus]|uniref:Uncharacterized protein n=1 Tax=Streptococcus anginosus TaxID=1328 RepID=A0AAW5TE71_STRAP|nr:hypothetical protein [Streptococcus anginosus]KAA9271925.1 hypothetical protein F6I20_01590 [Streptococcus anginosus]MCW0972173.1 hypothetical protein [Streptococcus anginosus]MCW1030611.1 hypothetical protein [Streptococcus anginosus]MCW1038974.1 hypothetical protein [Streptococcus anginosus]MCW1053177.1 hypothetical protein [Streptococcus anginosus]
MKEYIVELLSENKTLKFYFSDSSYIICTKFVKDISENVIEVVVENSIISHIINLNNVQYIEVS